MNILNNIWLALTTEDPFLINALSVPLTFIEVLVSMLLFTTVLNIKQTKKQNICYIIFASTLGILCSSLIPKPYSNIITLLVMPFAIMYIFKVNFFQSILAEFLPVLLILILEILLNRACLLLFNINYELSANIPLCRLFINLVIYLILFLIYKLVKQYNFNINILHSLDKKSKKILLFNLIFAIFVIFIQMYLLGYYNDKFPSYIILITILSLIAYFFVSIYSIIKTMKLEKAKEDLEQEKMYNQTLQVLYDSVRAFKHDFANIISGIGGYIGTKDLAGLDKYYHQLLQDYEQITNLSSLNPGTVNNPAVYSVLNSKYYKADSLGIKINLECFLDFNNLHMDIYEFTRILGILMDNAIEAATECDKKVINVIIRNDTSVKRQLLIIENSYKDKDINVDKIYEKGYSTKPKNTGLGLWEVNKIISRHKNLARFTSKTYELFKQQIEIYEK